MRRLLFPILAFLLALPATAQDLTDVDAIIDRANAAAYYAGSDGRAQVRLTITDGQGRERVRQFVILRRNQEAGGDQDYAVLFSRPSDVRGTVFLVNKKVGGDDDRWLYLPSLDLVKRIAAGDKRTSFVGSDFLYEDVSGREVDEDTHELYETTDEHYVVYNEPVDKKAAEFVSWYVWIDKDTFLPMKMEYVDHEGQVFRRIETLEVETIGGHPTATKQRVSDLRTGGTTLSEMRRIEYDLGIPAGVFTQRTLRDPQRQWFSTSR
jgi:hypothetical protein